MNIAFMKSVLRKIGNSRGVLLPASFIEACGIERDIELRLDGRRIVIESAHAPRTGWFDVFEAGRDEDAWAGMTEVGSEDWHW